MQETRGRHDYSNLATSRRIAGLQRDTAIYLGLSYLITGLVALGLSTWLVSLRVQPFAVLLIALVGAVICGLLCTLNLQYGLYLLELALSRLAHDQLCPGHDEDGGLPLLARWPLGSLFRHAQEIEQRARRYHTNERLTVDVREQALQQAREAAALAERNRIARELHDSIKQHIFGINASAAAAQAYWQRENMEGAREAVEDIERIAQGAQVEMQALLQQLRPAPLENASLLEALHIQAQALGFRTGACVQVDLAALPDNERLLPGTQEAIFRLVQEAFANVARHARARTVYLELRVVGEALRVTVRDDGRGFDPVHVRSGMGLANLRERTHALHGDVEINSQPGQGTAVVITIPLLGALRSPEEEARQRYELARADELARHGYQLATNVSLLGMILLMIGINTGWGWSPFLSLSMLGALLVTLTGWARGAYYRARVAASARRENRVMLELAQEHYRAGQGLLLLASTESLFLLWKLISPLGVALALWLVTAIALCLGGLFQFLAWRSTREMERCCVRLSTQEVGWELERRQQAFSRSLMLWGLILAIGLIFAHALLVFPPVTPTEQGAYVLVLILFLLGVGNVWNYRLIQRLKQHLRRPTNDQFTEKQEG